jgi:hypothetical protein
MALTMGFKKSAVVKLMVHPPFSVRQSDAKIAAAAVSRLANAFF